MAFSPFVDREIDFYRKFSGSIMQTPFLKANSLVKNYYYIENDYLAFNTHIEVHNSIESAKVTHYFFPL
jgi:hypothetical protein